VVVDDDLGSVDAVVFEMGEKPIHGEVSKFGEFIAVGQGTGAAESSRRCIERASHWPAFAAIEGRSVKF